MSDYETRPQPRRTQNGQRRPMTRQEARRRQKARRRARRRALIKLAGLAAAALAVLILLISLFVKLVTGGRDADTKNDPPAITETNTPESPVPTDPQSVYEANLHLLEEADPFVAESQQEDYDLLLTRLKDYPDCLEILLHPSEYSVSILHMAACYPETIPAALEYPDKKGTWNVALTAEEISAFQSGEPVLLIQWDSRWAFYPMLENQIATSGCGPVTLSMAYMALTGDTSQTPDKVAELAIEHGYYTNTNGSVWDLFHYGPGNLGLKSDTLPLSESSIKSALDDGSFVAVNFGPGDFTVGGHYALIVGYNDSGFLINDPNSYINSEKTWTFDQLKDQIKNLWEISK